MIIYAYILIIEKKRTSFSSFKGKKILLFKVGDSFFFKDLIHMLRHNMHSKYITYFAKSLKTYSTFRKELFCRWNNSLMDLIYQLIF